MSTDDVKSLVRQYVQKVWNHGDSAALDDLTTPAFAYYLAGQPPRNRTDMQQFIAMTHAAFPDWHVEIVDLIAEANTAAVRWQGQATHRGVFHGIPPTGKRVTVTGINLYRIADGKIAAEWEQTDSLGLLQQLGVLPRAITETDKVSEILKQELPR